MTSLRKSLYNAREYANNLNQLDDIQETLTTLHLFSFETPIINKIENSLKLFSIIIKNGKSYVENVKI